MNTTLSFIKYTKQFILNIQKIIIKIITFNADGFKIFYLIKQFPVFVSKFTIKSRLFHLKRLEICIQLVMVFVYYVWYVQFVAITLQNFANACSIVD